MNRRDFVRLMGLATGATFLDSCTGNDEKIIPYLVPPDDGTIPGVASYTQTSCTECPAGCGVSAKVMDYQVGKLEGLDGHPINGGALCMRGQASLSRLYHPHRLTTPLRRGEGGELREISWEDAFGEIRDAMSSTQRKHVFLSEKTTGTLSSLIDRFCHSRNVERLPEYELYSHSAIRQANKLLFGRAEIPAYKIDEADFVLTIGADILETFVSPVSYSKQFSRAKRSDGHFSWFHVEPHVSLTGLQAEERFNVSPGSELYLLAFLLRRISKVTLAGEHHIGGIVEPLPNLPDRGFAEKCGLSVEQLNRIAGALVSAKHPLVISGGVSVTQDSGGDVAVLTSLLQWAVGMVGKTVDFSLSENYANVGSLRDIERIASRLDRSQIGVMFISSVDPLDSVPDSVGFADKLAKAMLRVGIGDFTTASMEACDILLPMSHSLESWGDATPRRGLRTVIQPVIEPRFDTRTTGDILLALMVATGDSVQRYQKYLFDVWNSEHGEAGSAKLLTDGYLVTSKKKVSVSLNGSDVRGRIGRMPFRNSFVKPVLYVTPSIRTFDGRSRDLPLLNEIPDPLTTISWGAWISMSPESVQEMGISETEEVVVSYTGGSMRLPVKIQPGLARGVSMVQRKTVDPTPAEIEANSGEVVSRFEGVKIERTGRKIALPILSGSMSQKGRGVIPGGGNGHGDEHGGHDGKHATLYPDNRYKDYRWGMAIDLDLCTGCSACVAACYVENNVPVTGGELHLNGREMSWIRIEPYYEPEDSQDGSGFQPMLCQHCANAPCETVCPVFATYHSEEGLNAQIYNRCVGTRYCANNCPYKVRRFNWFDFDRPSDLNITRNPEVSVRGRGIMEKCSFCVQRIRGARDVAKDNGRKIMD
ncbi:MAG: 4Fe-4S dicluster domain-containing protein, partial [bacterium]|nr:4Fe-4S dicluster domain-containing protein [bacterium]